MTYRWVCPYCFDDHAQDAACELQNLKERIDFLLIQIELANLHEEQMRLQPKTWVCSECRKVAN